MLIVFISLIVLLLGWALGVWPAVVGVFLMATVLGTSLNATDNVFWNLLVSLGLLALPLATFLVANLLLPAFEMHGIRRNLTLLAAVLGFHLALSADYFYQVLELSRNYTELGSLEAATIFTKLFSTVTFAGGLLGLVILLILLLIELPLAWSTKKYRDFKYILQAARPLLLVMLCSILADLFAQALEWGVNPETFF